MLFEEQAESEAETMGFSDFGEKILSGLQEACTSLQEACSI